MPTIAPSSARRPARVLLVEDAPEFRAILRTILGQHPDLSVVAEADDGVAGLAAARQLAPDVVVTDLQMPKMDGLELTRQLRAWQPDLPIVMLTAFPGPAIMDDAFCAGVNAFLEKSSGTHELPALLRDVLASAGFVPPAPGTHAPGTLGLAGQSPASSR